MPIAVPPVELAELTSKTIEPVGTKTDISVLIPALHEGRNLAILLPWLKRVLDGLDASYEITVITTDAGQETIAATGGALTDGIRQSSGEYVLTLDADLSHRPDFPPCQALIRQIP